jgi:anti-sigma B factor antagonist
MTITKTKQDSALTVQLEGRLYTITAPQLEKELQDSLTDIKSLVLDFEKLDYVSSAGLRVLLSAQKVMNRQGEMKVIHVNETIREIFEVTGFTDILTIE